MKEETKKVFKDFGNYSTLGFSIVFAIVIGFGFGYWLDNYAFDTSPWFTFIFLGFGIAAGFRNIFIIMNKFKDK